MALTFRGAEADPGVGGPSSVSADPMARPACHTQLLEHLPLTRGDGPRITLQRQEPHVAPKTGPCPSGKSAQLPSEEPRPRPTPQPHGRAHPEVTEMSWLVSRLNRLPVCPSGSCRVALSRDTGQLASYVSRSKSPCNRMEQGFLELTADGNKPGGGSASRSEGRWARPEAGSGWPWALALPSHSRLCKDRAH